MGDSLKSQPQIVVVLKLPEGKTPELIMRAREILAAMTGNKWFPKPSPSLAEVEAATDALVQAEANTLILVNSVADRDVKRMALVALLQALASHVQTVALKNREHAAEIVESAAMYLKKTGGRTAQTFELEQLRLGVIKAYCPRAGRNAAYEFQYSLDGKKTWLPTKQPIQNHPFVIIDDLPHATLVYVQYRVIRKSVAGDWSDAKSILVE